MGPFYCPADERVYIDLSFWNDMERQLGAPGDFAWAYVIAHEVGHHVQQQLGTSDEVRRLQSENPGDRNPLSVRLELQADCYAGVWASTVFEDLEPGDIEEAIAASEAVGDDRLQGRAGGQHQPGLVHARQLGAARALVRARPRARRAGRLRHVLGRQPLARAGEQPGDARRAVGDARAGAGLRVSRRSAVSGSPHSEQVTSGVASAPQSWRRRMGGPSSPAVQRSPQAISAKNARTSSLPFSVSR